MTTGRITREQWQQHILHTLSDLAIVAAMEHSRVRVYPREADEVIRLTPAAAIDTFGNWIECIPADTILFPFHVLGMLVENQQAADTYFVQFASAAAPTDAQIIGEARLALGGLAGFFPSVPVPVQGMGLDANCPIYARVKAASNNGYWLDVSLSLTRHVPVSDERAHWPDWPW